MNPILARTVGASLVVIVSFTTMPLVFAQQQSAPQQTSQPADQSPGPGQQGTTNPSHLPPIELPENPGRSTAPPPSATTPPQQSQQAPQPNGTAVAPPVEVSGGAASKPAGVAIAPPKQHQIRSLLIKLGFLAGAGVAVGTVAALSAASPSHVPNSPGH